jgi:PKD repeat protein
MRKFLLLGFCIFLIAFNLPSQTCRDVSVELSAEVQTNPPRITLKWIENVNSTAYFVYRKLKTGNAWGAVIGNLPGTATQFVDTTVTIGVSYEYRVLRQADAFNGYGYINSGIQIAEVDRRGVIILIIDSTFVEDLSFEIKRLQEDLTGDGWRVITAPVSRNAPVTDIKTHVLDIYSLDPSNTKAIFLLGHVPVPYSGEVNVDGHADHTGAYPADVYYGEVNGVWTDVAINNATASDPRNHNVPEDGKFDQAFIPSDVDLQVGRVDFFNMPTFGKSELELLRQYLDKDHAYRQKEFTVGHRALIDDNFGYFGGEAFAASGWKNAGTLVGNSNVIAGDYFPDMSTGSYLWSYGCGGGWYQGAGGVGSTSDFANADLQSVFTMLFGSYFGDWDTPDNFLRAALAQGKTLTNVWSGRPHWEFHHMGLGENIGYSVRLSQNNSMLYNANLAGRVVHIALMGDPTLRNDVVAPPSNVSANMEGFHATIHWTASSDSVLGYHVYRKYETIEDYVRVNAEIVEDTFFIDSCLFDIGNYDYMVRAIVLQRSPSGTYYNLSQGSSGSLLNVSNPVVNADATFTIEEDIVSFTNTSINATDYQWIFGDGQESTEANPVHDYIDGDFSATLIARNECDADTINFLITILTGTNEEAGEKDIIVWPNPSDGRFNIKFDSDRQRTITFYSIRGEIVYTKTGHFKEETFNLQQTADGMFILAVTEESSHYCKVIMINH